jgi:imidazolonepropionase-like amidohydrolase
MATKFWLCALLALSAGPLAGSAAAQGGASAAATPRGTIFIRDLDAIWTANGEVLRGASIAVRDGVIQAIGANAAAPKGATVIDGRGLTAIPGIVDEHSHIAMDRGTNEGSAAIVPELRVIDALNPGEFGIYRALSGGVTTALILHGSANPIGAQGAIIKTRWGMDESRQLLVEGAPRTVKFALGENVTRKNFGGGGPGPRVSRFPGSRAGVESIYVQAFTAAQEYRDAWAAYRKNPKAHRIPPRKDERLEALVDIMEGRIKVHAHSYRSDEIVMLMRVAEQFGFKIHTFTHILEGYKVADELREHGAGASTFSDWWQYKLEAFDAIPHNAAIMHEKGVLTSLNSDIPWLQSSMVYEFNKPVKYGNVSKEEALRMLTLYPAKQLLIEDKVGSLEAGKHADVVLLSGDPFDVYSRVEKTIIEGVVYYDRVREAELRGEPVRELPRVTTPVSVAASAPTREVAAPRNYNYTAPESSVVALVGATVHPVSGPAIPNGVVVVRGGRIAAVGTAAQVEIPAGATRVDLAGKHLYPGMISPLTQLGMDEINSIASARDNVEVGDFNPHVRALTAIHPHSVAIPVMRANGITSVLSVFSSGIVQGMGSVIQLMGDTPERMEIESRAALVIDFPVQPLDGQGGRRPMDEEAFDDGHWHGGAAVAEPILLAPPSVEGTLEGERMEKLVALFERAVLYSRRASTNDDPTSRFEPQAVGGSATLLEAMVPAVTGQVPVFFRVRTEREIRSLLLFLDKFPNVRAVVVGGDQAFRVADELARRRVAVILENVIAPTSDRNDPVTARWENAGILHAAGVKVSFAVDGVEQTRNLPYHAAKAAAFGLPKEEALRAVTINTAEILGLGSEMGTIEPGKRADLIITTGDPLQIVTQIERAFIGGLEVSLESKHTQLYEQFRNRK